MNSRVSLSSFSLVGQVSITFCIFMKVDMMCFTETRHQLSTSLINFFLIFLAYLASSSLIQSALTQNRVLLMISLLVLRMSSSAWWNFSICSLSSATEALMLPILFPSSSSNSALSLLLKRSAMSYFTSRFRMYSNFWYSLSCLSSSTVFSSSIWSISAVASASQGNFMSS